MRWKATHIARLPQQPGSLRPYNQLERAGFVYAEEVIAYPDEALDTIVATLNAEPVPPADPMVTLLLNTAGEHDLPQHPYTFGVVQGLRRDE